MERKGKGDQICGDQHGKGEADTKQKSGVMALVVWPGGRIEALTGFRNHGTQRLREVKWLP